MLAGLIVALFLILSLFLSMLSSSPKSDIEAQSDTDV